MASKSKSRRRVLRASCLLAALIVAGSSFAWFASKDEVTNRLSASSNYGVTIAEDFTPPENWLPGQKVDKNVGVVNTGNVDAFVRTWLEGEMNVLAEKRDTQKWSTNKFTDSVQSKDTLQLADKLYGDVIKAGDDATPTITLETDKDLIANDLTYYYMEDSSKKDTKISLKELRKDQYLNPNNPLAQVDTPEGYSDVMAVQAGGELVYTSTTSDKFTFKYTPNQKQTIVSKEGATGGKSYDIKGGITYTVNVGTAPFGDDNGQDIAVDNTASAEKIDVTDLATFYKYINDNIDTNSFKPATTGLYIFKRNTDSKTNEYPDYEFTGYYYVAKNGTDNGADGKFFALQYENDGSLRSDYVLDKDTYTITRDNTGKVTFNPTQEKYTGATNDSKDYYKVGDTWYDSNGLALPTTAVGTEYTQTTLQSEYSSAADSKKSTGAVTLFTAQKKVVENSELTWTYRLNDGSAMPGVGTKVNYNSAEYEVKVDTSENNNYWYQGNTKVEDNSTINALNVAASKNNLEVENNGIVYTYDATINTWKKPDGAALSTSTDSALIARLNEAVAKKATLTATYYGAENATVRTDLDSATDASGVTAALAKNTNTSDDISVIINLTNIGSDPEKWTAIAKTGALDIDQRTFYYNNDVEEGATTSKIVDSVELSQGTEKNAYIAFDFDLDVFMDSIQVTIDDNGAESDETIENGWGVDVNSTATKAKGTATTTNSEITSIDWNYTT